MAAILVVDDRAINRELLATLLGYVGHEVIEAADGVEALAATRAHKPDLVITDVLMPNMDGVEYADCVHDDPEIASTPIIFYTATYRLPEAQVLAESCRVATVLGKPAEPQTILDAVAAALGGAPAPILMPQQAAAPPSFLGAQLPSYLRELSELQHRLRRVLGTALEEDRGERSDSRHDSILSSYQTLGLRIAAQLELGLALASERDPATLLDVFCRAAQDIMNARVALVVILDGDEHAVERHASAGLDGDVRMRIDRVDPTGGVFAEMLVDGKPRRIAGRDRVAASGLDAIVDGASSALIVPLPLRSTAAVRGWICYADRLGAGAFDEEDQQFAMTLAAQLGLAYGNAAMYDEIYAREPFVRRPSTKRLPEVVAVHGSNYCEVGFQAGAAHGGKRTVALFSALDNLIKGGAGQAIQNMNLVLGLDEKASLWDTGNWP